MPLKSYIPGACAALLLAAAAVPALADVKAGVDAWSRGDYMAAVSEWQGPAGAGDPDAMFNLAQAYRMGRGVAADPARAEALYAKAAAAGHIQAADTYGLMLFQSGRRQEALPYLRDAARRGDPRSQYLLGIAHFNGDLMPKDWVRAYALVTLANAGGLPQAAPALAQMDEHIPLEQRQEAAKLAQDLRAEADAARKTQLAAADLGPAALAPEAPASANSAPPRAQATVAVSPSIAAARLALEEASRATGTESPAEAGATFARRTIAAPRTQIAAAKPTAQAPSVRPAAAVPAPASSEKGPWRVQLGAFSVPANAERLWQQVSGRSELAGKQRVLLAAGNITRLQVGGFASRGAAETACGSLKRAGVACLVAQN